MEKSQILVFKTKNCGNSKDKLLFVVNTTGFFLSHRLPIALAALDEGYEVHVATGTTDQGGEILTAHGIKHHFVPLTRSGKNLFREMNSLVSVILLMRRLKPNIVHLVTIKPVLYGGIAARLTSVSTVIAAISGLGTVFTAHGILAKFLRRIVRQLYRIALSNKQVWVIFQNKADQRLLLRFCGISDVRAILIPGSGVDLHKYLYQPEPQFDPVITFAARLLKEKGVYEFVEAAKILKQRGMAACFKVVGTPDPGNPAAVSELTLSEWREEGVVEILGFRNDIADLFAQSNIICLPSYYGEGLPKVLIEAAACGRAVVTTDHPGCRDAIINGVTGLLVPICNPVALANAIETLIKNSAQRTAMGHAGRTLAENRYNIDKVITLHLNIYRQSVKENK